MTDRRLAPVATIYEANARQIPSMLRKLADEVERGAEGAHGEVRQCVVVTLGERLCLFGFGDTDAGDIHLLLASGQHAMEAPIVAKADV